MSHMTWSGIKQAWKELKRSDNRSRPVVIEIQLPFTPANEQALRVDRSGKAPITVAYAEAELTEAVQAAFPGIKDFSVKVRSNPNWRA
jgi:hypothetical protein